jgi:hypothetical protein
MSTWDTKLADEWGGNKMEFKHFFIKFKCYWPLVVNPKYRDEWAALPVCTKFWVLEDAFDALTWDPVKNCNGIWTGSGRLVRMNGKWRFLKAGEDHILPTTKSYCSYEELEQILAPEEVSK